MEQNQEISRYWVLTCEHAAERIPREYRGLGLARSQVADHIHVEPAAVAATIHSSP